MGLLGDNKVPELKSAERFRSIIAQETADLTSNARWYATLLLAILAGLVKYRQLIDENTLKEFTFTIAFLGGALAFFIIASLLAQYGQIKLLRRLEHFQRKVEELDTSGDLSQNEALAQLTDESESFVHDARRMGMREGQLA